MPQEREEVAAVISCLIHAISVTLSSRAGIVFDSIKTVK